MADKFLQHDASGGFREVEGSATGGSGNENKIPALDASGRLDTTMMPTGIGAETSILVAFGDLAAGDLVNVFNDSGVMKVRKADASTSAAPANGFVLASVTTGNNATVYWGGMITGLSGLTPGRAFLSTTAGVSTDTAPSTAANVVQRIGWAINATTIMFIPQDPILL